MNSRVILLFIIFFSVFFLKGKPTFAQYNELGFQIGMSRYKGELSQHSIDFKFLHLAGGVFYRHNWNRHWSWIAELNLGKVSGDDEELLSTGERSGCDVRARFGGAQEAGRAGEYAGDIHRRQWVFSRGAWYRRQVVSA